MSEYRDAEMEDLCSRIRALEAERDAYVAHIAAIIDQRNEAVNAVWIERERFNRMCLGFVAARAAIQGWASSCPCNCAACQTLAAHARRPE